MILTDREGGLWFTAEKEIRRVKNGKLTKYELNEFTNCETYAVAYEDRLGSISLGYFDGKKKLLIRIKDVRAQSVELPEPVSHFAEDRSGDLLLSVFPKGIYRIERDSLTARELSRGLLEPVLLVDGISGIASGHLCPDREGGIWIGTNKGLLRFMPQTFRSFSRLSGLPEDNVYPIYEDKAGNIWAGVWENAR